MLMPLVSYSFCGKSCEGQLPRTCISRKRMPWKNASRGQGKPCFSINRTSSSLPELGQSADFPSCEQFERDLWVAQQIFGFCMGFPWPSCFTHQEVNAYSTQKKQPEIWNQNRKTTLEKKALVTPASRGGMGKLSGCPGRVVPSRRRAHWAVALRWLCTRCSQGPGLMSWELHGFFVLSLAARCGNLTCPKSRTTNTGLLKVLTTWAGDFSSGHGNGRAERGKDLYFP